MSDKSSTRNRLSAVFQRQTLENSPSQQYAFVAIAVCVVSVVNHYIEPLVGVHSTALFFLLSVVFLALFVERGPTLVGAALSAAIWDYFFLPPVFAFRVTHVDDGLMLVAYFIVALVLGELTSRTRAQEKATRQGEARATALYLLTRELAHSGSFDEMLRKAIRETERAFGVPAAILLDEGNTGGHLQCHSGSSFEVAEQEKTVAVWSLRHGCSSFDNSSDPDGFGALFVPVTTNLSKHGVLCLRLDRQLAPHLRTLVNAFAQQIALALERLKFQRESDHAKWLAESERLSKTMLSSFSHELRTPIAIVKNATGNLLDIPNPGLSSEQMQVVLEVKEANERLDRLVGKALDIARLEAGSARPRKNLCDVSDVIQVAIKESRRDLERHGVQVSIASNLPLVAMDYVMTQQALMNLLSNAAHHTPSGSEIQVNAFTNANDLLLVVEDNGPGIPHDSITRVFEKFYRGPNAPTGGMGLGLSLVKGFVEAQGGGVSATNRTTRGAVFTIRLPLDKTSVDLNAIPL